MESKVISSSAPIVRMPEQIVAQGAERRDVAQAMCRWRAPAGAVALALVKANAAVRRDGKRASGIGPRDIGAAHAFGEGAHLARKIDGRDLGRSVIVVLEHQLLPSASHCGDGGVAVEGRGERVRVAAVAVHHIQLRGLIAQLLVVESQVGDVLAVRRGHRMPVRAAPVRQCVQRTIRQIDAVNFAVEWIVVGVGAAIGADQHAASVGAKCGRSLVVEIAVRQLARGAAIGGNDE